MEEEADRSQCTYPYSTQETLSQSDLSAAKCPFPLSTQDSLEADCAGTPKKKKKRTMISTRVLVPPNPAITSIRRAVVQRLTFHDSDYCWDAIQLVSGMIAVCGAHCHTAHRVHWYFTNLQGGFAVYQNKYIKKGPNIQLDIQVHPMLENEVNWLAFETSSMVKAMESRPKHAQGLSDKQLQHQVQERSRGQRCVIFVLFHLMKNLLGCAHRFEEISDADCWLLLQSILLLHSLEEDCYQLMLKVVFAIETMKDDTEFLTFLRNIWSSRHQGTHRDLNKKLQILYQSFNQDPDLGQVFVDVWAPFPNSRGKMKSQFLVYASMAPVFNRSHQESLHISPQWYFQRCLMAKALSMCIIRSASKDDLSNALDYYNLVLELHKEENSAKWKKARKKNLPNMEQIEGGSQPLDLDTWYLVQPLNDLERSQYEAQLNRRDNTKIASSEATVEAIKRLKGMIDVSGEYLCWLNSDPLNYYFDQMAVREMTLWKEGHKTGRSHCFRAFFYTQLMDIGNTRTFNYANVKRFGRKCPGGNIFLLEKLLIPINQDDTHWMLVVVEFLRKAVTVWDSYIQHNKGSHRKVAENILKYLKLEYFTLHKGQKPFSALGEWKLESRTCLLEQCNGDDCGIFTIMHADIILRCYDMTGLQSDLRAVGKYANIVTRCRDRLAIMMLNEEKIK